MESSVVKPFIQVASLKDPHNVPPEITPPMHELYGSPQTNCKAANRCLRSDPKRKMRQAMTLLSAAGLKVKLQRSL